VLQGLEVERVRVVSATMTSRRSRPGREVRQAASTTSGKYRVIGFSLRLPISTRRRP